MRVERLAVGATVGATWTCNGTPIRDGDRVLAGTVVAAQAAEGTWLEFHLTRADLATWPEGTYAVEVAVDGRVVRSAQVRVEGRRR